jgi:hypothetical protein
MTQRKEERTGAEIIKETDAAHIGHEVSDFVRQA